MSRSRARNTSESASLFPFLAVLLCTLGVLVLLLMAMASVQIDGARKRQSQPDSAIATPTAEAIQAQAEFQAKQQELAGAQLVRNRQREAMQQAAAKMSRIERSIRDHQDRLDQLRTAIAQLQALDAEHSSNREQAQERLAILSQRILEKEQELDRLRKSEDISQPAYAILPYDGPNGTRRRPIYIECLEDRVVIQPEGIELFPADFHPQLGQGNPLAAALRAATEFLSETNYRDLEPPYPLIVVRPEGIGSYAAVMGALSRWDSEYGYEMIPAEWELDCGIPNPQLASDMELAVSNARSSAAIKAARAPAAFRGSIDSFEVGPGVLDMIQVAAPIGGGHATVNNLRGFPAGSADGGSQGIMIDTHRLASALSQQDNVLAGAADGPAGGPATNDSMIGYNTLGMAGELESGDAAANQRNGASSSSLASGAGAGLANRGEQSGTASETSMQEGAAVPAAAQSNAGATAAGTTSSGPGSSLTSTGLEAPTADAPATQNQQTTATLASQSGAPNAQDAGDSTGAEGASGAKANSAGIGVERPIRVVVGRDRIVIGPRSSTLAKPGVSYAGGRTVMLDSDPQKTSTRFSKALQEHIGEWGMAGRDSYWRPVLILQVEAGGERLAADMASALRASGVDVQLPETTRR